MNLAEVQRLAKEFDRAASSLRSVGQVIDRALPTLPWAGRSVELFRQEWSSGRKLLNDSAQSLSGLSVAIMRNWQAQSDKSDGGSNTAFPISFGSGPNWNMRETFENGLFYGNKLNDLHDFIGDFSDLRKLDAFHGLFQHADDIKLGPLAALGTGWDTYNLFDNVKNGSWDGSIRSGIDVGFDIGGLAFPQVGLAKGAWDVGYQVGKGIDWVFGEKLGGHQAFIDSVVIDRYGGQLSPSEADDLAHRYDGWSGFGHFVGDNASNTADAARSLWKGVFG
jgi:uncharacterized protein YukE